MRSSPDQRLRDLLDAAPDAIIEVDEDGKILLLSGMTEVLFGYQRDELLGQSVEMLIPEELRPGHVSNRRNYFAHPLTRAQWVVVFRCEEDARTARAFRSRLASVR